jgi:AcrR family transcriptional regulator
MTTKRRARSADDKQQRREQILQAANRLAAGHSFASFSMAELAEVCGLAKGTLYLYFATKEELFLALLEGHLGNWFADLQANLQQQPIWSAEQASRTISATLTQHGELIRLLPIASSILEQNIPLAAARTYKEYLLEWCAVAAPELEQRIGLAEGDGVWLLLQIYALVVGLGQMADPSPVVREVLNDDHMAPLRVDFAPSFQRVLFTLICGLKQTP